MGRQIVFLPRAKFLTLDVKASRFVALASRVERDPGSCRSVVCQLQGILCQFL